MNNDLMLVPRSDLELLVEPAGHKERISTRRHEAMLKWRALLVAPAAQAVDEDLRTAAMTARDVLRRILTSKGAGVHYAAANNACHQISAALAAPVQSADERIDQLSQIIRDLNSERDELGAECGRLRAKLSAPVQSEQETCGTCDGDKIAVIGWNADAHENIEGPCPDCAAPVRAVRLPPRREPVGGRPGGGYSFIQAKKDIEWNACLDAVARLNGEQP